MKTNKGRLLKYLSKLVSLRTDHHDKKLFQKNAKQIIDDLVLLNNHLKVKILEKNGYPSLIMYSKSYKNPKLVLQSHLDVVPADEEMFSLNLIEDSQNQELEKLSPINESKIEGEIVLGRGVFDMKFAIACYMLVLEDIDDKVNDLDIAIWITSDEEIGGFNGVGYLLDEERMMPDCVFLPDGSKSNCLSLAAKGILQFKVESTGISSHSSRPWTGQNAIENIINAYNSALTLPMFKGDKDKESWSNTLSLTVIDGGTATNQIPEKATAKFDCRFVETFSLDEIYSTLKNLFNKYNCEFEIISSGSNFHTPVDNKYSKTFIDILEKNDYKYDFTKDHGASDARFFGAKNIPVIMFMPEGGGAHSDKEWLNIKKLDQYYEILKQFVLKVG